MVCHTTLKSHKIVIKLNFVQYLFLSKLVFLSTYQYSQLVQDTDSYKHLLWKQYLTDINLGLYIWGQHYMDRDNTEHVWSVPSSSPPPEIVTIKPECSPLLLWGLWLQVWWHLGMQQVATHLRSKGKLTLMTKLLISSGNGATVQVTAIAHLQNEPDHVAAIARCICCCGDPCIHPSVCNHLW